MPTKRARSSSRVGRAVRHRRVASLVTSRKRRYKRAGKGAIARLVKSVVMRDKELKSKDWSYNETTLDHNTFTYALQINTGNSTIMPAQGNTSITRDGNEIRISGIKVRCMLKFFSDRLNGKVLLAVVKVPKGQSTASYEQIFDNVTGNVMLDPFDKDKVTVLYKTTVQPFMNPGTQAAAKEVTRFHQFYIPINRVVKFTADAAYTHDMPYDLHLVAMAYDTAGSIATDDVATITSFFRTYWRDM